MSKQDTWYWQEFSYLGGKSRMDSRRAAFLVYDFVNMFEITDFRVLQSDTGNGIDIVYRLPAKTKWDDIEEKWCEYLENWIETH